MKTLGDVLLQALGGADGVEKIVAASAEKAGVSLGRAEIEAIAASLSKAIQSEGATEIPDGVSLTPVTARRRTSIAGRKGTSGHPAIAAFAAAIREQSRLLGAVEGLTSVA